jgi:hypothetical protein
MSAAIDRRKASARPTVLSAAIALRVLVISFTVASVCLVGGLLAGGEYLFSKEKERDKRTWDLRVPDTDE